MVQDQHMNAHAHGCDSRTSMFYINLVLNGKSVDLNTIIREMDYNEEEPLQKVYSFTFIVLPYLKSLGSLVYPHIIA
mgnify:CR=1 FL=1